MGWVVEGERSLLGCHSSSKGLGEEGEELLLS